MLFNKIEKQFKEMKRKHPDAVLLFCIDYQYVAFNADAELISEKIGIAVENGCTNLKFGCHACSSQSDLANQTSREENCKAGRHRPREQIIHAGAISIARQTFNLK